MASANVRSSPTPTSNPKSSSRMSRRWSTSGPSVWPCKQIAPTVDALADEYAGRLKVAKMDVDHHQIVPQQYGIRSIPTLLIFKGGKVVGQLVGAAPRSKLEAEIQKHL